MFIQKGEIETRDSMGYNGYPLVINCGNEQSTINIDDFPIKTSSYSGFPWTEKYDGYELGIRRESCAISTDYRKTYLFHEISTLFF